MGIRDAIAKLSRRQHLTTDEARETVRQVLRGEATSAMVAAWLTGLRVLGETVDELVGSAEGLLESSVKLPIPGEGLVDTCGTGGDQAGTFNVSTAAAFITAGAGCRVAKHGNRSVSSRCGSADVLEVLGIKIDCGPDQVAHCIDAAGMGFLFAPQFHPGMKHAMGPRRELGISTIFNLLGPVCNPARPARQVVGVYAREFLQPVGEVLRRLGSRHALVVHSSLGLDEATPGGVTHVYAVEPDQARSFDLGPEQHGLPPSTPADLTGGTALDNAHHIQRMLEGERGPRTDAALLNAALTIQAADARVPLAEALARARESIASGRAFAVLKNLRAASHA